MLDDLNNQLIEIVEIISNLEVEVSERCTYEFSNTEDQWRHDTLAELVAGIERLKYEDEGTLQSIQERLEFAKKIEFESITNYQEEWDKAIASISDQEKCPKYRGLTMKPQLGFVPIGRDPRSGHRELPTFKPERSPSAMLTEN